MSGTTQISMKMLSVSKMTQLPVSMELWWYNYKIENMAQRQLNHRIQHFIAFLFCRWSVCSASIAWSLGVLSSKALVVILIDLYLFRSTATTFSNNWSLWLHTWVPTHKRDCNFVSCGQWQKKLELSIELKEKVWFSHWKLICEIQLQLILALTKFVVVAFKFKSNQM